MDPVSQEAEITLSATFCAVGVATRRLNALSARPTQRIRLLTCVYSLGAPRLCSQGDHARCIRDRGGEQIGLPPGVGGYD
eukprot:1017577-Pyramimonas_sp.AAC.1